VGTAADAHAGWCRIAPDGRIDAVLVIDARDRTEIDVGSPVRISLQQSPEIVFATTVSSVSAIQQDSPSIERQAAYQVLCPLPPVDQQAILRWVGKRCKGVFHLPHRTLVSDLKGWIGERLGGR
jgi:hypothetical protein